MSVPDEARRKLSAALDLFGDRKFEEAQAELEAIIKEWNGFGDAYEALAQLLARQQKIDEAIRVTQELEKLEPDNIMVHTNLSVFYMKKGWIEKAEEEKAKATVLQFSKKDPK